MLTIARRRSIILRIIIRRRRAWVGKLSDATTLEGGSAVERSLAARSNKLAHVFSTRVSKIKKSRKTDE